MDNTGHVQTATKHVLPDDSNEKAAKKRVPPTFPIIPSSRFGTTTAPTLRHPLFIGDFSLDSDRKFHHDRRSLGFISVEWEQSQTKKVEYDLNTAMDRVKRKDYHRCVRENLDNLLMWILLNRYKFAVSPPPPVQQQQQQNSTSSQIPQTPLHPGQPQSSAHGDSSKTPRPLSGRGTSVDSLQSPLAASGPITSLSTDFVTYRGLLRDLMCSPYQKEGWIILATKFRRTIYLCGIDSVEKQLEKENETENQKRMCSWGYKFEQFMTDGADPNEGNDENKEYCCVLRSRLASHSLVYGAEVDGADPKRYNPPHAHLTPFVELKTNKEITTNRAKQILHKFKFQKWWSQSFLVGIPRVICGFRDDTGVVRAVQAFAVSAMPNQCQVRAVLCQVRVVLCQVRVVLCQVRVVLCQVRVVLCQVRAVLCPTSQMRGSLALQEMGYWSTDVMINFLDQFLSWVKSQVVEDDPNLVYQLTRQPGSPDVHCQCLGENSSAVAFLPQWYINEVFATAPAE
ncbi:RAI1-like [Trinorchestia longiramus]|nr:RAI1-like [Trinorchestia longiramus]